MTERELEMTLAIQRSYDAMMSTYMCDIGYIKRMAQDSYADLVKVAHILGFTPHDMDDVHHDEILKYSNYSCNKVYWTEG